MFKFIQKLDKIDILISCLILGSIKNSAVTLFNESHHAQTLTAQTVSTKLFNLRRLIHARSLYGESVYAADRNAGMVRGGTEC